MNHNLFQYATSELSQDAFICWLLSYAMKDCHKDAALSACARDFLRFFIPELKNESIYLSEAPKRQYKSIDVLLTVNDTYKVIIEDKTHTSDHDNQLMRYRETVANDFPEYQCIGVYYKTGFQSDLSNVHEADYILCDRAKIVSILSPYITKTNSDIFQDYYTYIYALHSNADAFSILPVRQWSWEQINGFFEHCQHNLADLGMHCGFGYIPNKNGGFYGMWLWKPFYVHAADLVCETYLQCEFSEGEFKICYRASSQSGSISKTHRDALLWKPQQDGFVNVAEKYHFEKPPRFGTGKSVALGVYNATVSTAEDAVSAIEQAVNDFYQMMDELDGKCA